MASVYDRLTQTETGKRMLRQELTILDATDMILKLMDEQGVSRTELAKRHGVTKGAISQLLDGEQNMTLHTLSDLLFALGYAVDFQPRPADEAPARYIKIPHWPQDDVDWIPSGAQEATWSARFAFDPATETSGRMAS